MTVSYDVSSQTSGSFKVVSDSGDVDTDAVMLAHVELPIGANEISQEYIKTDGTKRDKVARKRGILVQKRTTVPTVGSPRTGFTISDKVCWLGSDNHARNRVTLRQSGTQNYYPLVGSDGGEIASSNWRNVSGGSILSGSDMDEDGCYENPWIDMSFGDTSDTYNTAGFEAFYYAYVPFDEANVADMDVGLFGTHANDILCKSIADSPDSLSNGFLDTQMAGLLSLINDRIRHVHPDSASSSWTLLWRSNNVAVNSSVNRDTVSIYFKNTGFMLAHGGYISGTDFIVPSGSSTGNVFVEYVEDGVYHSKWKNVTSVPATIPLSGDGGWDSTNDKYSNAFEFTNTYRSALFEEFGYAVMNADVDVGGNWKYIPLLQVADGNVRIYWGGSATHDLCGLVIVSGAYWSDASGASGLWIKTGSDSYHAFAMNISRSGISHWWKNKNDSDWSTGWADTGWSSYVRYGDLGIGAASFIAYGNNVEQIVVPFKFLLCEDYVRAFIDEAYTGPTLYEGVTFRLNWPVEPSTLTFSKMSGAEETLSNLAVDTITDWGVKVSGKVTTMLDYLHEADLFPQISETYTLVRGAAGDGSQDYIYIDEDAENITSGQGVVVREKGGSGYNGMWIIKAVEQAFGGIRLSIDAEDGLYRIPANAYDTDVYVYFLRKPDNGTEVTAYYMLTVGE
jgi:hypothetical protein